MKKTTRLTVPSPPPPPGGELENETIRVGLYVRVSTDLQAKEGDSLEEQEKELRKYCDYRDFNIYKLYIEKGKSGGNTNRPEYQAMIRDIKANKINAIIVKKIDRLSRSLLDFEALMVLLEAHSVDFISLREQFDTTTALGKAMLRITLIFAQLEREQTSERIKDVFAFRAEQGLYNGGVRPFGYDCLSSELVPHKHERKVVDFIFDTFLSTESTTRTSTLCNSAGFRLRTGQIWDARQIHKILTRPIYKGYVKWNDQLYLGVHQPLVSEAKWDKVQSIFLVRKSDVVKSRIKGILTGILRCGHCHNPLMPSYTTKSSGKRYYYYRCKSTLSIRERGCHGRYIAMDLAHNQVKDELFNCSTDQFLANVQKRIDIHNAALTTRQDVAIAELNRISAKRELIQQKREKYLDSLMTGEFTGDERQKINRRIGEFEQEEKGLETAIWRQEMLVSEIKDLYLSIPSFKESIIKFKLNHDGFSEKDWVRWLAQHVSNIDYLDGLYTITFKELKMLT